jgi:hypothetical protein
MHGKGGNDEQPMITSIEQRIAAMLSATDAKSDAVASLIEEVEAAAREADEAATKARDQALDPAVMVDVVKVGAAVASAALARDRLQAALPRLQQQFEQAREREYTQQWLEDYAVVKARRDELVEELRERYPRLVNEMVGLMTRMAETDKEVGRVNSAAPYGDHPRLRSVELAARGVDRLMQPDISIPQELRLPNLHSSPGQLFAWPPPQPSFAVQLLHTMYPGNHAYAELARSDEAAGS